MEAEQLDGEAKVRGRGAVHALSIDVEDWYQGIFLPESAWKGLERRVHLGVERFLRLTERHGVRATCFVLGRVAAEHPGLVRELHAAGHEIASHGFGHREVYGLTPAEFRESVHRSRGVLEDLTGEPVVGYRAPYFTITKASTWALDVLVEEGVLYDSSINPVFHTRYGIPDAARHPTVIRRPAGRLLEVPVATYPLPGVNLPAGGGAYFRFYPYRLQRALLRRLERRGEVFGFYMHPWELDPDHPRIRLPRMLAFRHYFNLRSTEAKLDRLLQDFRFAPYRTVYADLLQTLRDEAVPPHAGRRVLHPEAAHALSKPAAVRVYAGRRRDPARRDPA